MSISEKSVKTLEFDKVRRLLRDCCRTEGARLMADTLEPTAVEDRVISRQKRTTDAKRLVDVKGYPPFGDISDVSGICDRALKGATLGTRELLDVAALLRTARLLRDYIRQNRTFPTVLDEVFERLLPNRFLEDKICRSIISEELISDDASTALADIRRKIRSMNARIKEALQKYIGGAYARYLQENIVTMRNGRYVVPVKAEYRNEIKGLVHDTSSSGATVFVEPMAVVDANNELRTLESKEAHEIERILAELSADVAGITPSLNLNYSNITELAFAFGCAELSAKMDACEPDIISERKITLKRARHPLIDREAVVPIDVSLGGEFDTLIITGPNTGGKTVTLKTLGLFALMAQSGLHIPAEDGSGLCVFERILVDLGDEQSIEQSLSTFSSHMVNIVGIIKHKNDRSLVLFDELGAGTDPVEGAALAVAVIEDVRSSGALCAATTHYTELKTYALDTPGVCNASCEFDVDTLRPTYRLIMGAPGKSNAFAISSKLGLPDRIINRASELVGTENKHFENVIGALEESRFEMDRKLEEIERMKAEYERFKSDSEALISKRLAESESELEKAKSKAAAMVDSAKASSDFILSQMDRVRRARESEKLGEELTSARRAIKEHLRDNSDKFNPVEERTIEKDYRLPRKLRRGDEVMIVSLGKKAVVTDEPDKSGKVGVQAGIIKTKAELSDLQLIENTASFTDADGKKKDIRPSSVKVSVSRDFRDEIDLRGMTGEEGWNALDKYLDEAMLSGFRTVRVIHGKGTGALKNILWSHLRGDPRISSFRIGKYGEGDGGVTVVEIK